jgi:Sporulation and spore germination
VPLTITPDLRANRVVQWLVAGPSPWLVAAAQPLPLGSASEPVVTENGKLVVKFNAEVAAGPESLRRLLFQLQWSLRTNTTPALELRVDNKVETPANDVEYLQFNLTSGYGTSGQRYDIGPDQKVVANPPSAAAQAVLAAPENQSVVSAAIAGGGTIAAYVRQDGPRRHLWVLRGGGASEVGLNPSTTMGRPVFVSPAGAHLLITSGGRLFSVSTVDGFVTDMTRNITGITAVSASPDGRRVAFVANGNVYVSPLILSDNVLTMGSSPRPILSGQIAAAVAWTNEVWLNVVGSAGGASAMWRVTADGVVARNLTESLLGATVSDIVAYPSWPSRVTSDVYVMNPQAVVYLYLNSLTQESTLHAPFFGT